LKEVLCYSYTAVKLEASFLAGAVVGGLVGEGMNSYGPKAMRPIDPVFLFAGMYVAALLYRRNNLKQFSAKLADNIALYGDAFPKEALVLQPKVN
jgi:hypothetical protein